MEIVKYRSCHLCEANCGLQFTFRNDQLISVRPDLEDVFSRGHICPKGVALQDLQSDPDRITRPLKRIDGVWREIGWSEAIEEIAARMAQIALTHGKDAIATYSGNPGAHSIDFVTHASAVARVIGTRNRFSANSVDANPPMLVSLLMFGHQLLLPIPDVDRTQLLLILGANPVVSNGSLMGAPAFKARLSDLRARGGRLIVVDPRRTETAKLADVHHFIPPGSDAALIAALLIVLREEGLARPGPIEPLLLGMDDVWRALDGFSLDALLRFCGFEEETVRSLARELAGTRSVAYGRIGLSIQPFAALSLWLLTLLNIAIGALDREGGAMFPQPAFDPAGTGARAATFGTYRSRVSGYPECLDELPVAALAEEILTPGEGQIRALVTFAGNPVLTTPNGRMLDEALARLELMVSFDIYLNETSRHAHYVLPSPRALSVPNYDVSINFAIRNIARLQPALMPLGEDEQPDWVTFNALGASLAAKLGREFKPLPPPLDLVDARMKAGAYQLGIEELARHPHGLDLGPLRPCIGQRLRTGDKRIHCAPPVLMADLERLREAIRRENRPELAIIGRRETRANNSWMHNIERLAGGKDRCVLLVHPSDLAGRGLSDGDMARVRGEAGEIAIEVRASDDMMPGVVCMPHGWGHDRDGIEMRIASRNAGASLNDILDHRRIDLLSGNSAPNGSKIELAPLCV